MVHAGAFDGSLNFNHVAETRQNGVDRQRVAVGQLERGAVELVDGVDGVFAAVLSDKADVVLVSIAGESACIFKQCGDTFVLFHFIEHGTLDFSGNVDQTVVGADDDDVVGRKADVSLQASVQDEVVNVDGADEPVVAVDFDVAQGTDVVRAARHVEGMENRGERGERVGARGFDFPHDVHGDGARLADGQADF